MTLRVYNSLSRTKETFETVQPGRVGMYLCGPTVYKPAHIGHMVGPVIFDTIKRYLVYNGFDVNFVINITDIDESSGSSSITVSTGAEVSLAFKTAPDYENPQDANQDNYYKVTVNVSDGQQTISREITVRIDDVQD